MMHSKATQSEAIEVLTSREEFALWMLLNFYIARYLMSVTQGRQDPSERAEQHIQISKIILQFAYSVPEEHNRVRAGWKKVHDYLAEHLTDYLDKAIGFPIDRKVTGTEYDEYVEKFFKVILKLYTKMIRESIKDLKENGYW